MRQRRLTPAVLVVFALVCIGGGDLGAQENPVSWSARAVAKNLRLGDSFDVTITGVAEEEWHVYSVTQGPGGPVPTTIAVAQPFSRHSSSAITNGYCYQAGVSDVGNNDKIIGNVVSGAGYNDLFTCYAVGVDADVSFTNRPKVHANK